MSRYPLRVTPAQWQDIRGHYEEDEPTDWTDMPVEVTPFPEPEADDHLESSYEDRWPSDDEPPF